MYEMAKHIHLSVVVVSVALFIVRFIFLMKGSELMKKKALKVVPHVVDTFLLISAIWLVTMSPMVNVDGWLASKIVGLVLYIVSGLFAFKWAKNNRMRLLGFFSAMIWLSVTFGVAVSKQPLSFLA
ncbi:SirB2 family protein [Glaciecola sp. KUL10]|jgi:uncharacterized membrane protein SirB2|uniref:SirB2 family protein n=1 Tax=Glaciecola sp. (strain KUL10) TaxID=2161813 RepID=UPI000D787DD3|nr:SirB2 family protein [Glaciecola sp. KUL10]GBL03360.1 invasion gene expression up-regulator, SirB [Glaciecola sp. KUL10]